MSELLQTLPRLKKIDPCEGCSRICHDCKFKEEHEKYFRIQDQAIRNNTRDYYLKLHAMPQTEHIPHDHGTTWNDCLNCDSEITDGKLVNITIAGRHSIIHICNGCYLNPDFQEDIKNDPNCKITNF